MTIDQLHAGQTVFIATPYKRNGRQTRIAFEVVKVNAATVDLKGLVGGLVRRVYPRQIDGVLTETAVAG